MFFVKINILLLNYLHYIKQILVFTNIFSCLNMVVLKNLNMIFS